MHKGSGIVLSTKYIMSQRNSLDPSLQEADSNPLFQPLTACDTIRAREIQGGFWKVFLLDEGTPRPHPPPTQLPAPQHPHTQGEAAFSLPQPFLCKKGNNAWSSCSHP